MKTVLLSFDLEEFDTPIEYGKPIEFDEQIRISHAGTKVILDILQENQIAATFFSTVVFASHARDLINRISSEGHELASHGYYHSSFQNAHLLESKVELQKISGKPVKGFRMARMMQVSNEAIRNAGYLYNSSLNPIFLPGRYNNLSKPRTVFEAEGTLQIPASVTPLIRLPLFWLSFHNFPLWLYKGACANTINQDSYLNIYFHPWEFIDVTKSKYGLPTYVSKNSGDKMIDRFCNLIRWMKKRDYVFSQIQDFASNWPENL